MDIRFTLEGTYPEQLRSFFEGFAQKPTVLAGESLPGWLATFCQNNGELTLRVEVLEKVTTG